MIGMQQHSFIAKKYAFDILQERYHGNEELIARLTHYLATENDVRSFCQMLADAFTCGYEKSVTDYREKLREMGYEVSLTQK